MVASCPWKIEGPNDFLLSEKSFPPERHDDHAIPFYHSLSENPPVVERLELRDNGTIEIQMTGGYTLTLEPNPAEEDRSEDWRLMAPYSDKRGHLVLSEGRVEWSG